MNRILIIDDHMAIGKMIQRKLESVGFEVSVTSDIHEGIKWASRTETDLVLLDHMMPGMDGLEVFNQIRKAYTHPPPVVMMAAFSSMHLAVGFMRQGGADFMEKPLEMDVLEIKIRRIIAQDQELQRKIASQRATEEKLQSLNHKLILKTQELAQLNADLDSFNLTVTHDLRAPLRHLTYHLSVLEEVVGGENAEIKEPIEDMREVIQRMNRMIKHLFDFSRLGQTKINYVNFSVHTLVDQVLESLKDKLDAYGAKVQVETLPDLYADPHLMKHVFHNLIGNALKFTQEESSPLIQISACTFPHEIHISVADNGVGFQEEEQERIFKMFHRLHPASRFEGDGIGLATVKRILKRHRGNILATSVLGKGATFTMILPRRED
ncbi:MAG: response regulator [Bacteroidota bacterium]